MPGRLGLEPCSSAPQFVHICGEQLGLPPKQLGIAPQEPEDRPVSPSPFPTPRSHSLPFRVCLLSLAPVYNLASPSSLWQEITAFGLLWPPPHCLWLVSVEPRRTASSASNFAAGPRTPEGQAPAGAGVCAAAAELGQAVGLLPSHQPPPLYPPVAAAPWSHGPEAAVLRCSEGCRL